MKTTAKPKGLTKHYKITEIRAGQMTDRILTRRKRDALDPNDVDVQIDEPRREVSIKRRDGVKSKTRGPRKKRYLGNPEWRLLSDAVFLAGDLMELKQSERVHQWVSRLRRFFGDSKKRQRFFITTAALYAIAINTERTWRFIEALAE